MALAALSPQGLLFIAKGDNYGGPELVIAQCIRDGECVTLKWDIYITMFPFSKKKKNNPKNNNKNKNEILRRKIARGRGQLWFLTMTGMLLIRSQQKLTTLTELHNIKSAKMPVWMGEGVTKSHP